MASYEEILQLAPYSLRQADKQILLTQRLVALTRHHYQNCLPYRRILDAMHTDIGQIASTDDIPFLPVSLFKARDLLSVEQSQIIKTLTSSGTTGQAVSKIYLDKTTAANQQKTLVKIVSDFIGSARLPLLIIDSPSVMKNRQLFSARGAGILGFSIFASDKAYALDEDMALDLNVVGAFLEKHRGKKMLLFGFTFMVWQHFYKQLLMMKGRLDLSEGLLIHGGGWKKLQTEAVSRENFANGLSAVCRLQHVYDYYGMVEQTGCICMQCEHRQLHTSIFSEIIIRNHQDFSVCPAGQPGIIQVLSLIPESYPGHSLLTEDEGVISGESDCPCGRSGKTFRVLGRLKNTELRGCSDTYAAQF